MLWLWCRPAAVAPIGPLAWELPYAADAALKERKERKKERKRKEEKKERKKRKRKKGRKERKKEKIQFLSKKTDELEKVVL